MTTVTEAVVEHVDEPEPASTDAKYPPPPPEKPAERKARLIALFVMPFLMVTMMYATYMGTMHAPTLEDVPVAVIGQGAGAEQLAEGLEQDADGTLDVRVVGTVSEAERLLEDQEISGALALPEGKGREATLYTASGGGASLSSTVTSMLTPVALAQGWTLETVEAAPLQEGDTTGTLVLFAAMGMMLAGYVPLSMLLMALPNFTRLRRFAPAALVWSAVSSSVIWLILGPIVGVVEGHYLLFLGVGTLATMAVGMTQLLFTKFIGPLAVLPGMLLWVVFGMPASNLSLPIESMPAFFQWLHQVLPLPAAGESLRSWLYFDGSGFWPHILVLAIWLAVSLVLVERKEAKSGPLIVGGPAYTAPDAPLPALAGGPVAPYWRRIVAVIAFPATILIAVVTVQSASMHQPDLSGLPVAIVGQADPAGQMVDALAPSLGESVDLEVVTTTEEAEELIKSGDLAAAYVLPTSATGQPTLMTASGLGKSQQSIAISIFSPVAQQSGMTLQQQDIVPLTDDDTGGSNSMYVAMSWIMAGFLICAVMRGGAPDLTRTRKLLPMFAGWSVGISVWLWFLFDVLIGAVNGHAWAFIACGAATVFAVALASSVLTRLFGLFAIVPVMLIMMLGGLPASGGALSIYMVPELFRSLDFLPLPAAVEIARSLTYLDGAGVADALVILGLWGAAGLVINLLVVDPWVNRKGAAPPAPMGPRHSPERKPKGKKPAGKKSLADLEQPGEEAAVAAAAAGV